MAELLNGTDSLNVTDASNTARFPESQAPSTVNGGARALEGMIARYLKDANGSVTLAGSATAYTMALNADSGAALYTGMFLIAEVQTDNTGTTPTLNVTPDGGSALGAKTITKAGGVALVPGDMQAGMMAIFIYDGTNFELLNPMGLHQPADGTGINSVGSITFGAGRDASIYWNGSQFNLHVTNANTNTADFLDIRNSTSGTAATGMGTGIRFYAEDDGGTLGLIGGVHSVMTDVSAGSEDADLVFRPAAAGSLTETLRLVSDGTMKFSSAGAWTANGTNTVTISNVAPAGVGTATIGKWLTVVDNSGTTYFIPAWT